MSNLSLTFAPWFSWQIIAAILTLAGLLCVYGLYRRLRGSILRLLAVSSLGLALANPSILQEERAPLKTVIALVVDQTDSQKLDGRKEQTDQAHEQIKQLIKRFDNFELREVVTKNNNVDETSTALFSALKSALQDVPPEQVGGAVMITDGQIHDVPKTLEQLGITAPLHGLITGKSDDKDRRIIIHQAPRFGIVGESQEIIFSVEDTNISAGEYVDVTISIDGVAFSVEQVIAGEQSSFIFDVPHGGKLVIELQAAIVDGEITDVNNHVFSVLEGIRENLRVLLVSGEPHAGERTWRNLLKSDASVDLVHFTILRPPEKQDGTPINQLSLIAFPTRELFIEKIDEFDLIIFDRYQTRRVLPILYFDNIARYLTDGGAILIAAGPEHAARASIHNTPLSAVLPITPTGNVIEKPFTPRVSDVGRRHPVTRGLKGLSENNSDELPKWSRWFRVIEGTEPQGHTLMEGPDKTPLLILNRPGEGRIAMLMSDHVWLWARDFEGGGPHSQLLRRLGHWLMKQPDLDEEALRAHAKGNKLVVERQTMGDDPGLVEIVSPDGKKQELQLADKGNGLWSGEITTKSLGLYRLENGELSALTNVGPSNPKEYAQVISTGEKIRSLVEQSQGSIHRIDDGDNGTILPRIVPTRGAGSTAGDGWIGLRATQASRLIGVKQLPLMAGFLGLALLLLTLSGMWAREGR